MKVFGCLAFTTPSFRESDKFQPRGIPCVFLGYSASQKGYKLLSLVDHKIRVSRDVIFEENIFPFHKDSAQAYMQPTPVSMVPPSYVDDLYVCSPPPPAAPSGSEHEASVSSDSGGSPASGSAVPQTVAPSPRRSTRAIKKPAWLSDYVTAAVTSQGKVVSPAANQAGYSHLDSTHQAFLSALDNQCDPTSFTTAVQSQQWCDAMNVELQALERNGTWSLTRLPPEKKAIGCKWLYKTKYRSDGTVERHKARLV